MKKIAAVLAALLAVTLCAVSACAVEEGEYPWREWTLEVTKVEENPMFVPAQMGEDEYAVAVYLTIAEELWQDEALSHELYTEAVLADADGNTYEALGSMTGTDNPVLIYLYCVPKGVEAETLRFVTGGETEEAGEAEEAEETEEAEEAAIPEEMIGTWEGAGIPPAGGSPIDLTVVINEDGTGEYIFIQGGYTENNPIEISYEGNSFSVNTDDSVLNECVGTWELADGVLTLDITSTLASGATYSYTAELTMAEGE